MQLIQQAGILGAVVVVVFVVALFSQARRPAGGGGATPWALALLALGQIGQALSQRAVADALEQIDGTLQMLAIGSAEASANLLLAGACALIIVVVAGARDRFARA